MRTNVPKQTIMPTLSAPIDKIYFVFFLTRFCSDALVRALVMRPSQSADWDHCVGFRLVLYAL